VIALGLGLLGAAIISLVGNVRILALPIFVLVVVAVLVRTRVEFGTLSGLFPNKKYVAVITGVTALMGLTALITWEHAQTHPSTLYFVVDSTSSAKPYWNAVYREINAVIQSQPGGVRVGVRIYGGVDPLEGCPNTRLLLPVAAQYRAVEDLGSRLARVVPGGHGSLTAAVLDAIDVDLESFHDPVKLFVITSNLDTYCDPLGGGILDSEAKPIRRRAPNIDLLIATVGRIAPRSNGLLRRYAMDFGGCYLNTSILDLPRIINRVSAYGSGYVVTHQKPRQPQSGCD
jgi:hypothetical protein